MLTINLALYSLTTFESTHAHARTIPVTHVPVTNWSFQVNTYSISSRKASVRETKDTLGFMLSKMLEVSVQNMLEVSDCQEKAGRS